MFAIIGLLIIFFIGKYYYDLATLYNKKGWLFVVLGIVSYYLFLFIIFLISLGLPFIIPSFFTYPIGALGALILYKILENSWKKNASHSSLDDDILDDSIFID